MCKASWYITVKHGETGQIKYSQYKYEWYTIFITFLQTLKNKQGDINFID